MKKFYFQWQYCQYYFLLDAPKIMTIQKITKAG